MQKLLVAVMVSLAVVVVPVWAEGADFEKVTDSEPEVEAVEEAGKDDKTLDTFGAAYPAAVDSINEGKLEQAREQCDKAFAVATTGAHKALVGKLYISLEMYPQAREAFAQVLAGEPESEAAYFAHMAIGATHRTEKNYAVARKSFVAALAAGSTLPDYNAEAHKAIAACFLAEGNEAEAKQAFEAILQIANPHPDYWSRAHCQLGLLSRKAGRNDEAIDHFIQAVTYWAEKDFSVEVLPAMAAAEETDIFVITGRVRKAMAAVPENADGCARLQELLVNLLLAQGEQQEALYEAKVLWEVGVGRTVEAPDLLVARCFQAVDGSEDRSKQFTEFAKWGKAGPDKEAGTADDLANPLTPVSTARTEARNAPLLAAIAERSATDWKNGSRRARLYRYAGTPEKALAELREALKLAPANETAALQALSDKWSSRS